MYTGDMIEVPVGLSCPDISRFETYVVFLTVSRLYFDFKHGFGRLIGLGGGGAHPLFAAAALADLLQ